MSQKSEIQEVVSSSQNNEEDQESRTTNGAGNGADAALAEEENTQGDFKLEDDSEEELPLSDDDAEDDDDENRNGYGQEMMTETAEDQYTSEQTYEQDDFHSSSLHDVNRKISQKSGMPVDLTGIGASLLSRSYLTKQSKHTTDSAVTGNNFAQDLASQEALKKLKNRIQEKIEQKNHVDPDEVIANLKGHQYEKIPLDTERLDLFFRKNKFLSEFSEQTDRVAAHECYKAMVLQSFESGRTVFRYGAIGDECFFVIKGRIAMMEPVKEEVLVRTEQDLIKFYAEHYDDIIWEKIDEADEIKHLAKVYKENPNSLDFQEENLDEYSQAFPEHDDNEKELFKKQDVIQEDLERPASAYSNKSYFSSRRQTQDLKNQTIAKDKRLTKFGFTSSITNNNNNANSKTSFYFGSRKGSGDLFEEENEVQSDKTYTEEVWLFKRLGELGPGESFGQAALVHSKPHLVTYQCLVPCEIASFNRESYMRIVEKAVKRDFMGRIQFLKSFKVLSTMSQTQLETLLYHVKLVNFERGTRVYKHGEKPDGVYLIQEGSFELTRPGQISAEAEKAVEKMNVDPMAKFQLRKQTKVIKDTSRATVKLAILGNGEIFGLEECCVKPTSDKLRNRTYSVTCCENKSKAIFINHQTFAEKVLMISGVEHAIKYDCALKEFFHNSRELQYQQTVWNGSITSIKQIEDAAAREDADFEQKYGRGKEAEAHQDLKGTPRLRTVDQYFKDKYEAEILNKIMGQIHERTADSLSDQDPDVKAMIQKKMKEVTNHFDSNINVINAERKRQKDTKERLKKMSVIQKAHEEQYNLSVAHSKFQVSQSSPRDEYHNTSMIQDSLMSSQAPGDFQRNMSIENPSVRSGHQHNQHYGSFDQGNMKVIHSVVKQKRPLEMAEDMPGQNFQFVSVDHDTNLVHRRRQEIPVDMESSEIYAKVDDLSKKKSQFGLNSEVQSMVQQSNATQEQSIVIEQHEEQDQQLSLQEESGPPPITAGSGSNAEEFKGLQGSNGKLMSQTPLAQFDNEAPISEENDMQGASNMAMNKTQDAFKPKDNKLLDMFTEGENSKDQQRIQNNASALPGDSAKPTTQDSKTLLGKEGGGIIVSKTDLQAQVSNQLKKHSNVTEIAIAQPASQQANNKMVIKELSETTGNPSNLGNISQNIRDPRYSQDLIRKQKAQGKGKKIVMKQGALNTGQRPFGLVNLDQQINIPKVNVDSDGSPVHAQDIGANEGSPKHQNAMEPHVNITTRLTNKQQDDGQMASRDQSPPETSFTQPPATTNKSPNTTADVKHPVFVAQKSPNINELPFNDFITNRSGLKGAKRNQNSYASKTINDKNLKTKLRIINKDSAGQLPEDVLQNMSNSFTADMPEVYTEVYQKHDRHSSDKKGDEQMFPSIHSANPQNQQQFGHPQLVKDSFMRNADISMIDTAQFSEQLSPLGATAAGQDINRIVETHHSNQSKREVFVPSQPNPLMKRQTGKSLAEKRLQQLRGASAKSMENKYGKNSARGGQVKPSVNAPGSFVLSPHAPLPPHMTSSSRHQSFDQTGNSYAKQMQNPDDTQYRAAMMREAHQQQMMMEAARSAANSNQSYADNQMLDSDYEKNFGANSGAFNLSPAAAAAASELIQRFITNPGEPISTEHFLSVQRKYELPPFEAYQLLLQQIQFQKALLTPPTAATVIKVSHHSYTSAVHEKRSEVINFRNDLFRRYTYKRKKSMDKTGKSMGTSKGKVMKQSTGMQAGPGEPLQSMRRTNQQQ